MEDSRLRTAAMDSPPQLPDFSRQGLVAAIAQDARSGRVLMLAYMNEEAYRETVQSGYAVYYSRSRQRLWRKGEESGHRQRVESISVDCDGDTVLLHVVQHGAACHEGYGSCFFRVWSPETSTWEISEPRLVDPHDVYRSLGSGKSDD